MPSFTLRSNRQVPWRLVVLVCVTLGVLSASAVYTLCFNPEVVFFKGVALKKLAWSQKITGEYGKKLVVYGGSSCTFSIDAERLTQIHHLPAVNAGLAAGMGPKVLTQFALSQAKMGDTLVVALEAALLTGYTDTPSLGNQFSVAMGHMEWLDGPGGAERASRLSALLALRPGGYHFFTLVGKCFSTKPLYRYSINEVSPGGWQHTPVRIAFPKPPLPSPTLPPDARRFLEDLKEVCQKKGIKVFYSLSWGFVPAEDLAAAQRANARLLLSISELIPVLKDPRLGCDAVREHFADTAAHLVVEAAELRTDDLADQIQNLRVWSREELAARAQIGL
jgi:hypothetical protein